MYIPSEYLKPHELLANVLAEGGRIQGWSSFIGIVTAIIGNILISFALNTQRYAHLRLSREHDQHDEKQRQARRRRDGEVGYGTQQKDVAEERAKANLGSETSNRELEEPRHGTETDPLIPSMEPGKLSRRSSDSGADEEDEDDSPQKSYLKSPIWWLGISMMTVGEAGNFLAYGFAPASIVSPLGVVALISNCLIAPLLLHERFRWRDALGVVIAVGGCITVVMSASDSNPRLTPDSIWHLITRWEFLTYFGITVFLIVALCAASNRYGDRSILIDIGLVGLFGGYTALSTKGVASLLSNTIWRVVTFPITYLLVAVLIFTAVMQIKYINRALQRFNATMVIPTQFVMFTLSVIVGSAILYRDFERTTTEDAVKFVAGCALTFLGVWFITSGRGDESNDDDDDESVDVDGVGIRLTDEEGTQPEVRERPADMKTRQSFLASSSQSLPSPSQGLDETVLRNKQAMLSPAKAAAIHENEASYLPTKSPNSTSRLKPPPMHATTSSPEVPTTDSGPKTPLRRGVSTSVVESPARAPPSTPNSRRPPPDPQHLDPQPSRRPLNRHSSVAGLIPGPLTSPLSSSLSAIVADSLRRGVDQSPNARDTFRRRSSKLQRRGNAEDVPQKRHSIASGEMDFDGSEADVGADARRASVTVISQMGGRMRSLSATVGDIFGTGGSKKPGTPGVPESRQEDDM